MNADYVVEAPFWSWANLYAYVYAIPTLVFFIVLAVTLISIARSLKRIADSQTPDRHETRVQQR
ncbi:MAG: hypothetical protein ACTHZ5_14585 [Micrococcaceae bacterium]